MKAENRIYTSEEKKSFESYPIINASKRKDLFTLYEDVKKMLADVRGPSRAYLWVRIVYFKIDAKFYDAVSSKDLNLACKRLGVNFELATQQIPNRVTSEKHHDIILKAFGFKEFAPKHEKIVSEEIRQRFLLKNSPRQVFDHILKFMKEQKIEIPRFSQLEKLILDAQSTVDSGHSPIFKNLTRAQKAIIKEILTEEVSADNKNNPGLKYQVSYLKTLHHSPSLTDLHRSLEQYRQIKAYYFAFHDLYPSLAMKDEGFKKVAIEFMKMDVSKIKALPLEKRAYFVISFLRHQYFRLSDHLVDLAISYTNSYLTKARNQKKEILLEHHQNTSKHLVDLLDVAVNDQFLIKEIFTILNDERITYKKRVDLCLEKLKGKIKGRSTKIERLCEIRDELSNEDHLYADLLFERFQFFKKRIVKTILELELSASSVQAKEIIIALKHLRSGARYETAPKDFLSETQKISVTFSDNPAELWQIFLTLNTVECLKSGDLNLLDSYRYKSLEDYLIPKVVWDAEKAELIDSAGLASIGNVHSVLESHRDTLQESYASTNQQIKENRNAFISFTPSGKFRLNTPATDFSTENLLFPYFPRSTFIPLSEVIGKVHEVSGLFNEFEHLKFKYVKDRPALEVLVAGVMGLGCNIGPYKMAKISKNIPPAKLEHAIQWYFSIDGLTRANDKVVNLLNDIALPKLLQKNTAVLHTSSDGQRWSVARDNILSKHSYKFFGKQKGISVNAHIDERHLAFHSTVISTTDREAASVLDGLLHNEKIRSSLHSTDTHGYTEVLFGVMELLGFKFAPRIKGLKDQRIYSFFRRPGDPEGHIIPSGMIQEKIIVGQWDEILRFLVTIKLKHSSAQQLFKRLNSYSRQHPLYRALKEYGKIHKSFFILEYVRDVELRQKIEKQLNKIEESNRLARAISFGNNQELLGDDVEHYELAEASRRLIKNCIICWNYLYLTKKLMEAKKQNQKIEIIEALSKSSILHYQHMNFHGEYDFRSGAISDSQNIQHWRLPKLNMEPLLRQ